MTVCMHLFPPTRVARIGSAVAAIAGLGFSGCAEVSGVVKKEGQTRGGAEATFVGPRQTNPADVALPNGYTIEVVATGFTYPTGVLFDDQNRPYVTESGYSYGERCAMGRLIRVEPNGKTVIAQGKNQPWTGEAMFVVDFGVITTPLIPNPRKRTGVLWRITRS